MDYADYADKPDNQPRNVLPTSQVRDNLCGFAAAPCGKALPFRNSLFILEATPHVQRRSKSYVLAQKCNLGRYCIKRIIAVVALVVVLGDERVEPKPDWVSYRCFGYAA
jgi:hypothetical protein